MEKKGYTDKGVTDIVVRLGKKFQGVYSDMELSEINCKDKMGRSLSLTFYSADGTVIESGVSLK